MISNCPACSYSLIGLPEQHSCPECGFAYDRHTIVVEQDRLVWKIVGATSGVLLAFVLIMWWCGYNVGLSLLIFAGLLIGSALRLRSPKRVAIVDKCAVTMLLGGAIKEQLSLTDVRHAEWCRVTGAVVVTRADGTVAFRIPKSSLWSDRRARALASAISSCVAAADAENGSKKA